jgi:hypothetical protein
VPEKLAKKSERKTNESGQADDDGPIPGAVGATA